MRYRIQHTTTFEYDKPIHESVMELRMQPRTDSVQRCLEFDVSVSPNTRPHRYEDFLGNVVHHFDVPSIHERLEVTASSLVDVAAPRDGKPAIGADAWKKLDALIESAEFWDWLHPSHFAVPGEAIAKFAEAIKVRRRDDPLSVLNDIHDGIAKSIKYERGSTKVDSPIEDCLSSRKGVCQDFAHVFITLARGLGIPARYVSGYLFDTTSTGGAGRMATHAWAEAFVPEIGWMGFDPSNQIPVTTGHLRVAVGRDYADVPPTRGTFKGMAATKLSVKVSVTQE
jgi:transglutaminase-like putative cysteine protease